MNVSEEERRARDSVRKGADKQLRDKMAYTKKEKKGERGREGTIVHIMYNRSFSKDTNRIPLKLL